MRTEHTDPRYAVEVDDRPTYRVDFVGAYGATEEFRIFAAPDLPAVQRWVGDQAAGRGYTVWVEYAGRNGTGLAQVLTSR